MRRAAIAILSAFAVACLWAVDTQSQSQVRGGRPPALSPQTASKVSVDLTFVRSSVPERSPVMVNVLIKNISDQTIFIPSSIPVNASGFPANLQAWFEDANGKGLPGISAALDRPRPPEDDFYKLVFEYWVAIPPGYSYGTVIDVTNFIEDAPPGRYRLSATYSAEGLNARHMNNPLGNHQDKISLLPYPAWEGVVECDPIWIEIIPQ
jgi:hypothetical protein